MTSACEPQPEPTCEDRADLEYETALREYGKLCDGESSIEEILRLLIAPSWATDSTDQRRALAKYLTIHKQCRPTNHKETVCVECEESECSCPSYTIVPTGCPDPNECPSKVWGYGLLEIIRAAVRADSIEYVPYAHLSEIQPGETLVWAPLAVPDNRPCEPCEPSPYGAFVPAHLYVP